MCFDVAPLLVYDAAQLALHCLERIVNGFGQRRMRAVIHLLFSGNQFVPWSHRHIDADVIRITLLVRVVSLLDGHVAAVDVIAKFVESRCIFQNEVVDLLPPAVRNRIVEHVKSDLVKVEPAKLISRFRSLQQI